MVEPIWDTAYWERRLKHASDKYLHFAIYRCSLDRWRRIEENHRKLLADLIQPRDTILDVGCGWGRLLELLSPSWKGGYLGIDLSPDFIELGREKHPDYQFKLHDLREPLPNVDGQIFEWAILISIRPMVIRNLGRAEWDIMEANLRTVAKKLLFLEYDEKDKGSIE